jgi:hypothetical protein
MLHQIFCYPAAHRNDAERKRHLAARRAYEPGVVLQAVKAPSLLVLASSVL